MTEQLKIANHVSRILNDQSLRIFREHAKRCCAESQTHFDEKQRNAPGIISDKKFDVFFNEEDLLEEESVSRDIPRDPIRGGEDFKPATTISERLSEQYTALAALHDEELKDDIQILADIPGSHFVKARIKGCGYRYNTDFYKTALECVKTDLQKQTDLNARTNTTDAGDPKRTGGNMDDHKVLGLKEIETDFFQFLKDTAKHVYILLKQDRVKKHFQKKIDDFMELWNIHREALKPYEIQAEAENKTVTAMDLPVDPLCWFTSPTIEKSLWDRMDLDGMTSIGNLTFPAVIRKPNDNEKLMCYYVKLAVIQDLLSGILETQAFFFSVSDIVCFTGGDLNADLSANGKKGYIAQNVWDKITLHHNQYNNANKTETQRIEIALKMVNDDLDEFANSDIEIDSKTKKQKWRDVAPDYLPSAKAITMADSKISAPALSKLLRKQGNLVRWMCNEETKRSKVHTQDFMAYIKSIKTQDEFSEATFRKAEIDKKKAATGR
jgi:hypothetical protein